MPNSPEKKIKEVPVKKMNNSKEICNGIPPFMIQLIITSKLSEKENLWLKSLTNDLKKGGFLCSKTTMLQNVTIYTPILKS